MDTSFGGPNAAGTAAGGVLGSPLVGLQQQANRLNVSRTGALASRLHELVDLAEKFVAGSHAQVDRVNGSNQPETKGAGPTPPSGSHLDRLEHGLRRLEELLKTDAAALYHRLTEL